MPTVQDVIGFWFGAAPAGLAAPQVAARWYEKDAAFDRQIRERFLELQLAVLRGECEAWLQTAEGRLAYVLVLDQFPRNMFRDTLLAFAADPVALRTALEGLERSHDRQLSGDMRVFMYLPLMHSEDLAIQEECVRCFADFMAEATGPLKERLSVNHDFAVRHRDIVARFGRFPHRNKQLARLSTPEEVRFLAQPGAGF
jgi:uncharacterized protein (DUF924 family)